MSTLGHLTKEEREELLDLLLSRVEGAISSARDSIYLLEQVVTDIDKAREGEE